jgi:hypothetical protein
MPKRINPQDQWETDFQVPLPGEPRNIGPLEVLFQRLLNRTERLKNRLGAILGLPWDATPPDTLAGLAGRVSTLESSQGGTTLSAHRTASVLDHPDGSVTTTKLANGAVTLQKLASTAFSTNPTPNTLVLRTPQGTVQDGVNVDVLQLVRVNGLYTWSASHKWIRLVKWNDVVGNRGIFADLHIIQGGVRNLAARLRARVGWDQGNILYPMISLVNDSQFVVVEDAVLVQTGTNNYELWVKIATPHIYVSGVVGTNSGSVEITPYGLIAYYDAHPNPTIDGAIYLHWSIATVDQTFPSPGHVVVAARSNNFGYIRYDNGIQVCWGIVNVDNGTWTFPAAFASPPQVQATPEHAGPIPRVVTLYNVSMTGVNILRTDLSGNPMFGPVHLYAVGLWK